MAGFKQIAGIIAVFAMSGLMACTHVPSAPVPPIHSELRSGQSPTVVFINGNAATLDVWDQIEAEIHGRGYQTFRSDREGLGKSVLGARPYRVENELRALETALSNQPVVGEKIIVAHSYGGLIAAMLAAQDDTVIGVVLVDAMLPTEMTPAYNASILEQYQPQFAAVRAQAPDLAEAIIPVVEAFPETGASLADLEWPNDLPVITIRAMQAEEPEIRKTIAQTAHSEFVAQAPTVRQLVLAQESGHQVMVDEPNLVIEAITSLIEETPF